MRTWPGLLPPAPAPDGWNEQPQDNAIRFAPTVGRPISRRRSTANGVVCQADFMMTDAQLEMFWSFYFQDLHDGTLPYIWAHPKRGVSYAFNFVDEQPQARSVSRNANRVSLKIMYLS